MVSPYREQLSVSERSGARWCANVSDNDGSERSFARLREMRDRERAEPPM
jgi:hypothetical protein